jgi:hypothetical protein
MKEETFSVYRSFSSEEVSVVADAVKLPHFTPYLCYLFLKRARENAYMLVSSMSLRSDLCQLNDTMPRTHETSCRHFLTTPYL